MADIFTLTDFHYSIAGSNTLTNVSKDPTAIYQISVYQNGGSAGFLQVYNNGTIDATAGSPDFAVPVSAGTFGAGTPSSNTITYGPYGRRLSGGLSYLWAAGPTGTVAHGVNCTIDITYRGTL